MTSIPEMDEFFDFEEATAEQAPPPPTFNFQSHDAPTGYELDMMLASCQDDEDSFHSLQHYSAQQDPSVPQAAFMGDAYDFNDFPRWTNNAQRPVRPCNHCFVNELDCVVIPNTQGICTSCVALSKNCNFAQDMQSNQVQYAPNPSWDMSQMPAQPMGGSGMASPNLSYGQPSPEMVGRMPPQTSLSPQPSRHDSVLSHQPSRNDSVSDCGSSNRSGVRFSRATVRILRDWSSQHYKHPYPTEEEKAELRKQTGLSKVQITNWLANARRRGLIKAAISRSPSPSPASRPMNIPAQQMSGEAITPMERWQTTPPEHEPASISAIANAMATAHLKTHPSPYHYSRSDAGSGVSRPRGSSASSVVSGESSGSLGSANSFGSFSQSGRRRRRKMAKAEKKMAIAAAPRPYQCTFCREAFKTKHDWQRHEKSLHLSLERWICAPDGGVTSIRSTPHCVFCGFQYPTEAHLETHNYSECLCRTLEERTFFRKDHLRQHLRLVHNDSKFLNNTMENWKMEVPNVRSRCGFCSMELGTWNSRVDHLAEHFKLGFTMQQWQGDWGFDPEVLALLENTTREAILPMNRPDGAWK